MSCSNVKPGVLVHPVFQSPYSQAQLEKMTVDRVELPWPIDELDAIADLIGLSCFEAQTREVVYRYVGLGIVDDRTHR